MTSSQSNSQNYTPTQVAQGQLEAYNIQDLDAFLSWYAEDIEVYNFPNELTYKGIDKMRERYAAAWKQNPNQKATITNRLQVGNTIVDEEHITGRASGIKAHVIAIYTIENGKIKQVHFIRK